MALRHFVSVCDIGVVFRLRQTAGGKTDLERDQHMCENRSAVADGAAAVFLFPAAHVDVYAGFLSNIRGGGFRDAAGKIAFFRFRIHSLVRIELPD